MQELPRIHLQSAWDIALNCAMSSRARSTCPSGKRIEGMRPATALTR